ncbi:DUF1835 domain-containing protein [Halopseudomonas salegens]|uniref:DUF1835 domain-containing protein n=1 Tax=Halopseudomonas salegens TaxID=1434072 RepID=A0A1H2F8B5_9GAMM|nr:DUF1835 domain-containing protein [Halopseudomonas salegens]SDU03584.1 protein of unknown function [Halopseudomonas salegens]
MSAHQSINHGRFNLEQQRKRAKELLKAIRNHEPSAIDRVLQHLPPRPQALKLSDTQLVVARECGFASWPKLKAHIDTLDFASRHAGLHGDQDAHTLHIRCGSDIRHSLTVAGFQGDFLEFSDPFCIGPVPADDNQRLLHTRAEFLAGAFDMSLADSLARLSQSYSALDRLDDYERLVLWFEHDSYDQLILAYLLHRLHQQRPKAHIELIAVESIPGVERFIGIGQLAPDLLAWLWPQRQRVNEQLLQLGSQAWAAITADRPDALVALIGTGTPALPMMARALDRHLRELPACETGLGLSETLTLEIVRDHGPLPVGKVFSHLMRTREPLPYLGDLMFWWMLQPLLTAADPLLEIVAEQAAQWPQRELALTRTGQAVLAGDRHWLRISHTQRWVGGMRIVADQPAWCLKQTSDIPVRFVP